MSKEDWEKGKGICDCDDSICITVKSDRSLNSHLKGNCHHPDGTHHTIHSSQEETHCPNCNGLLKSATGCHVHSNQCCTKCENIAKKETNS